MKDLLDRILNLPRHQKIGVLALVILLLVAFDYLIVYSSYSNQIANLEQDVVGARKERDKKRAIIADKPKLLEQLELADGRFKEAMAQLPDRKEMAALLTNISNRAREGGLEVLLFRPRPETMQEFYAEVPVDIVVRGKFHDAVGFFDEVGRLTRLVNLNNIEMKNPKPAGEQMSLDTSTLMTAFRFLDDAERAKVAAEKAAKEKAAKK
jgi:type IV pilus assembly protein PilO